jgi:hypothetical protein
VGEKWPVKFSQTIRLLGSLTCRKAATWERRLYFPSEGRHAEDFYVRKIRPHRPGLNPRNWVPEASMLTAIAYCQSFDRIIGRRTAHIYLHRGTCSCNNPALPLLHMYGTFTIRRPEIPHIGVFMSVFRLQFKSIPTQARKYETNTYHKHNTLYSTYYFTEDLRIINSGNFHSYRYT